MMTQHQNQTTQAMPPIQWIPVYVKETHLRGVSPAMLIWFLRHIDETIEYRGKRGPLLSHCYRESQVRITQVLPGITGDIGCSEGSLISIQTRPGNQQWHEDLFVAEMNEARLRLEFLKHSRQVAQWDQIFRGNDQGSLIQIEIRVEADAILFGERFTNGTSDWMQRYQRGLIQIARILPDLYHTFVP